MRILIIHNSYLQHGGEDEVVKAEREMLEKYGHKVTLYTRSNLEIQNLPFFKKVRFVFRDIFWSRKTYGEIRRLIRKTNPDIVSIHNTFLAISPSVYDACHVEGVPVVQTLHNYRFLCPIGIFYRDGRVCEDCITSRKRSAVFNRCWKKSFFASFVLTKIIQDLYHRMIIWRKITHFIVLSNFSRRMYLRNDFLNEKISVKPNFIDFDPGVSQEPGEYGLFVGGIFPYKGIKTLVQAWEKLPKSFPLKVVGEGDLLHKIKRNNKSSDIEFLGQRPLNEVLKYMKNARFVVVPSECYENFPRVIVEARACGVPVIASRIGAIEELVEHNVTGLLFEPQNADDLKDKLEVLIGNQALAKEMGRNSRRAFEANCTVERNYEILMDIYQKVIRQSTYQFSFAKVA